MATVLVLRKTPDYRKGDILKPMTIGKHNNLYGLDRVNKFHTVEFIETKPDTFEIRP